MKWAAAGVFSYCISGLPLQDGMDGVGGGRMGEALWATRLGKSQPERGSSQGRK